MIEAPIEAPAAPAEKLPDLEFEEEEEEEGEGEGDGEDGAPGKGKKKRDRRRPRHYIIDEGAGGLVAFRPRKRTQRGGGWDNF